MKISKMTVLISMLLLLFSTMAQAQELRMSKVPGALVAPEGTVRMVIGPVVTSATCEADNGSTCSCNGPCWAGQSACGCVDTGLMQERLNALQKVVGPR